MCPFIIEGRVMFFKKKSKEKNKVKEKSSKKVKPPKSTRDILPIRNYDDEIQAFQLEDGSYLDIVMKVAEDVDNMLDDEIQMSMMNFLKFLRLYNADFKLIVLNFPINTLEQQEYFKRQLEKTNVKTRRLWLERTIDELERAEKGCIKKEYFIMHFGKTKEEIEDNRKLLRILNNVEELSIVKKMKVIFKMNNQNSIVTANEEFFNG